MATLEQLARQDAINALAEELLYSANEILRKHGPDPENKAILGAGFIKAIEAITGRVDNNFTKAVILALGGRIS